MGLPLQYRVTIEEDNTAESFKQALNNALDRIENEETVASVKCLSTGKVKFFEIHSGELIAYRVKRIIEEKV